MESLKQLKKILSHVITILLGLIFGGVIVLALYFSSILTINQTNIEEEINYYNDTLDFYKAKLLFSNEIKDSTLYTYYYHINNMKINLMSDWIKLVDEIGIKHESPLVKQTIMIEEFINDCHELQNIIKGNNNILEEKSITILK